MCIRSCRTAHENNMIGYMLYKLIRDFGYDMYQINEERNHNNMEEYEVNKELERIDEERALKYSDTIECVNIDISQEDFNGYFMCSVDKRWLQINIGQDSLFNWEEYISGLPLLKYLSITGNLDYIPDTVMSLTGLIYLEAMNTSITRLPAGIKQLKYLEYLDISSADITCLPDEIGELADLKIFRCFRNPVTSLPASFRQLVKLQWLGLNETKLTAVPEVISGIKDLKALYMGQTDITYLPDWLQEFNKLEHLAVWETNITELPDWITRLTALKGLYLGRTRGISKLPADRGELEQLSALYLDGTGIRELPESFSKLHNLVKVNLHDTLIRKLPDMTGMTRLNQINLSDLTLERIPAELIDERLPITFEEMGEGLCLHHTGILCQPVSLFTHDISFIRTYYTEEKVHLNEAKIVFLGDGESGKSHIIERIFHNGEPMHKFEQQATPGISIRKKEYLIGQETVCLQFWDFGGQEIMHSMHRFFLTERTLYVIVLNSRDNTQDERAQYWLNNIKSFANGCPVIIVLNKIDQNISASLNERMLMADYPQIVKTIKMSALKDTKEQFDCLIGTMKERVMSFESYAMDFPISWNHVKNELLEMNENYIVDRRYRNICSAYKVCDEKIQNWLLDWFHDLGVSFNYHRKDELLGAYMVLKPHWITNAIYIILFNGLPISRNGIIKTGDIVELLKNPPRSVEDIQYDISEVPYILGVMRRFEISYSVDEENEFIPMLCEKNENESAALFYQDNSLEYYMRYEYLPNNVLHKLMIKMCGDIDKERIWLTGMILRSGENNLTALVRMHDEKIEIFVRSREETVYPSRGYLNTIRNHLLVINRELNLDVKDMIVYKENGVRDEIPYDNLIVYLNSGEDKYFSTILRKRIPIIDILSTVESKEAADVISRICREKEGMDYGKIQTLLKNLMKKELTGKGLLEDITGFCTKIRSNYLLLSSGTENDRNTFLRDMLESGGYDVRDQTLMGIAPGGGAAGELDLLVMGSFKKPFAILEALNLDSLKKSYLGSHMDKVFIYDTVGMKYNYIICYVTAAHYDEFWKKYLDFVGKYSYKYEMTAMEEDKVYSNIRTARTAHDRDGEEVYIYHIVVNMN